MRNPRHSCSSPIVLASAVLAGIFLVATLMVSCNQTKEIAPATQPQLTAPTTQQVYVIFEGPWAIAPDPKDANSVLLLAPKTKHHRDLYVTASNHSILAVGVYDLSFPGNVEPGAGTYDPAILRAKIDPKNAQRALDSKSVRYAIRLPKPDAYLPAHRHHSHVGSIYPPDTSAETEYATTVSLRYSVSSLSGFSLSGSSDTGTFNPLLLQVDTPAIRFVIEPTEDDDICNTHSRQAFHDLAQLVGLTLYVDFAENPNSCHGTDPQGPSGGKLHASLASSVEHITALLTGNLADVQGAGAVAVGFPLRYLRFVAKNTVARRVAQRLEAAIYFFGASGTDCKSPIVGGT